MTLPQLWKSQRASKATDREIVGLPEMPLFSLGWFLILEETETLRKRCTRIREAT